MKTMTETQEKNHMDTTNLSSRTPLGQLMRGGSHVYTPSRSRWKYRPSCLQKKILVIFGSPLISICDQSGCVFPPGEVQVYLWVFRCGNIVLLRTRIFIWQSLLF